MKSSAMSLHSIIQRVSSLGGMPKPGQQPGGASSTEATAPAPALVPEHDAEPDDDDIPLDPFAETRSQRSQVSQSKSPVAPAPKPSRLRSLTKRFSDFAVAVVPPVVKEAEKAASPTADDKSGETQERITTMNVLVGDQNSKRMKKKISMKQSAKSQQSAAFASEPSTEQFTSFLDRKNSMTSQAISQLVSQSSPSVVFDIEHSPVAKSFTGVMVRSSASAASMRSDVASVISAGDEIFAEFKLESEDVMRRYVHECHHNWKRATAQHGIRALLVFGSNDRIQKEIGLNAIQTRQILLGTDRIIDKWGTVEKLIRQQAVWILEQCLITVMEPNPNWKPLEIINVNTFVERKELVFIRVWKSRREGRAFQHALKSLTQARQDICLPATAAVPYSVGLVFQARFVTVTWLVPLIAASPQYIPDGSIILQLHDAWKAALGLPPSTEKESEPLPLYVGGDGRYYCFTMKVLTTSLNTTVAESTRHERFEYNSRDDQVELVRTGVTASPDAHTKNGVYDRLIPALTKRMKDLKTITNSPDDFICHLFHCCGVNMQALLYVRDIVISTVTETDVQYTPQAQRGDFEKAKRFVIQTIDNEVAARSLKTLILGKIADTLRGLITVMPKEQLHATILKCANTIIEQFFKSSKFIRNSLLPIIKRKFTNAPEFEIDMHTIHFVKVMRHLEDRLGLHFDRTAKEFDFVKPLASVLSTSGRRKIPYCPLNDAAAMSFEFLAAQKAIKRDGDSNRRTLSTLLTLCIAATGINLSIEGCFTVFTESMSDALIKQGQLMERDLQKRGLTQPSKKIAPALIPKGATQAAAQPLAQEVAAPYLLLTGVLGELVQKESPAITLSEFDLLYRNSAIMVIDKMYIAQRCHVLYDTFTNYPDEDVNMMAPLILNLWGRAISRGVDNIEIADSHIGEIADDKNLFQDATRDHAMPSVTNLEKYIEFTTSDDVAEKVNLLPSEQRHDLIRGLIAASIVVQKHTAERCALFIVSFCDALYDSSNEVLHPALADALLALHDALPVGSALAYIIAILLAPTLMQLPSACTLTLYVASLVQRLKVHKKSLLLHHQQLFPMLCNPLILRQFQRNITAGVESYESHDTARQVAMSERVTSRRISSAVSTQSSTKSDDNETRSDFDESDDDDVSTISDIRRYAKKRIGHEIVLRMHNQFQINPEARERLEFRLLQELYEQQHMILQEYCWRVIYHDEWERRCLQIEFQQSYDLLCRQCFILHLLYGEYFLRNFVLNYQEMKRRNAILQAHKRAIMVDERDVFYTTVESQFLNLICRQKIKERIERQERDARYRREIKYFTSLYEFVEAGTRDLIKKHEQLHVAHVFERSFLESAARLDLEWRRKEQLTWFLEHTAMKEFDQRQKITSVAMQYPTVLAEWSWRKITSQMLFRAAYEVGVIVCRLKIEDEETRGALHLAEASRRARLHVDEESGNRHFLQPKSLQVQLRLYNQKCNDVEMHEQMLRFTMTNTFAKERLFMAAAERKQVDVVLAEDYDRKLKLTLHHGILTGILATYFLEQIDKMQHAARTVVLVQASTGRLTCEEYLVRGNIALEERTGSDTTIRRFFQLQRELLLFRGSLLSEQESASRHLIQAQSQYTPPVVIEALVALALGGADDLRKKERRHFSALISALNIEETTGSPRHDEQRLTTQARRRVIDIEFVIRKKFAAEEKQGRTISLDEYHARITIMEQQESERLEWRALMSAARHYVIGGDAWNAAPAGSLRDGATAAGGGPLLLPFHPSKAIALMGPSSQVRAVYSVGAEEFLEHQSQPPSATRSVPQRMGSAALRGVRATARPGSATAMTPAPPAGSPRHLANLLSTFTAIDHHRTPSHLRNGGLTSEGEALFPSISRRREQGLSHTASIAPTPPTSSSTARHR